MMLMLRNNKFCSCEACSKDEEAPLQVHRPKDSQAEYQALEAVRHPKTFLGSHGVAASCQNGHLDICCFYLTIQFKRTT